MPSVTNYKDWVLTLYVALVFAQSAWHKLIAHADINYLFNNRLDSWAAVMGFAGTFSTGGALNAQVIGRFEMLASVALVVGLMVQTQPWIRTVGACIVMAISSGQLFFHVFTPLGLVVHYDGASSDHGLPFVLACSTLLISAWVLWRQTLGAMEERRI